MWKNVFNTLLSKESKFLINVIERFNLYIVFFCAHTKICIYKGIYIAICLLIHTILISVFLGNRDGRLLFFPLYNLVIFKFLQVYIILSIKRKR